MAAEVLDGGQPARPAFYVIEQDEHGHAHESPTILGFWIYLMSDALIFAALFATFAVLSGSYAGGPAPREIFELPLVALNTTLLLLSSITFGFAMLEMHEDRIDGTRKWLIVTAVLGGAFVCVELFEFSRLIADGAGPQRSAFLSAFFTLVSTHGLHVTTGIIWIVTMLVQIRQRGLIEQNRRRLACLSLFWHFLDIVWIGVFTFVYLFGVIR